MERRVFLGLSAAAIAALGSGTTLAQGPAGELAVAVAKLADLLDTGYVIPEVGKRYAAMLRGKLSGGAYATITDPVMLADRLTADLIAVAPDKHLRIVPEAMLPPGERVGGPGSPPGGRPAPRGPGGAPSDRGCRLDLQTSRLCPIHRLSRRSRRGRRS